MSSEYILSLPPRTLEDAEPRAKAVLQSVQASMKFVPNMYAVMANSPGLLETYLHGYTLLREESGFTPAEQEAILLTISRDTAVITASPRTASWPTRCPKCRPP